MNRKLRNVSISSSLLLLFALSFEATEATLFGFKLGTCRPKVKYMTQYKTITKEITVPMTVVKRDLITSNVLEVLKKTVNVEKVITTLKQKGIHTITQRSLTSLVRTAYSTVLETITKPALITITNTLDKFLTTTKFLITSTYKRIPDTKFVTKSIPQKYEKTVTEHKKSTRVVTKIMPLTVTETFTQLHSVTNCPNEIQQHTQYSDKPIMYVPSFDNNYKPPIH